MRLWMGTFILAVTLASAATAGVDPIDPSMFLSDEIRVYVDETGLWRLNASDLVAKGFPTDVPRRFLRLYQKRASDALDAAYPRPLAADVPVHFAGAPDPEGIVQPDDEVIFYGLSPQDDAGPRLVDGELFPAAMPERPDNYNTFNVYWVVAADPGQGQEWARMEAQAVGPAQGSLQPWYRRVERFTGDVGYQPNPASLQEPRYHWNASTEMEVLRDVVLHHPVEGREVDVAWTMVRRVESPPTPLRMVCSLEQDGSIFPLATVDVTYSPWRSLTPITASLSSDVLVNGWASFRMVNETGSIVATFLGDITLEYDAYYHANADVAQFHTGQEGGAVDLEVTGFTGPELLLFEVTDPYHPRNVPLIGPTFRSLSIAPKDWILSLHIVQEPGEQRSFLALPPQAIELVSAERLERDPVADVIEETPSSQALAIGLELFSSSMQAWLDWRRANDLFGWSYEFVDVQQIYDHFSGGLKSPDAIKAFTQYAYTNWDARALLLVGDANEDARGISPDAGADLVPTHLHIQSFFEDQLVASDKWYGIFCPDPAECAGYPRLLTHGPDMLVGRLPAADESQLDAMIAKIVSYEQPLVDDDWRARTLWVSDDAWSSEGSCYTYHAVEEQFALGQQANADLVSASLDGAVEGTLWNLDDAIDPTWRVAEQCQDGREGANRSLVAQQVANVVQQPFQDLLGEGWLMVSYQGHSSSKVLTHEALFQTIHVPNLGNEGRPFVFFGMGGWIGDFIRAHEGAVGPSLGEDLLSLPGAGAIATYASTAVEFLSPNRAYLDLITRNFFERGRTNGPVLGLAELPSQWVLGEQLAQSDHDLLALATSQKTAMMAQYNLLGDPLLRVDAAPPRIQVSVDGDVLPAGEALSPSGAPTLVATIDLVDESGLSRMEIVDTEGRDHTGSIVWVEPSPDPRSRQAIVELPNQPAGYEIEITVYDGSYPLTRPAVLTYEVPVRVSVASIDLRVRIGGRVVEERAGGIPAGSSNAVEIDLTSPMRLRTNEIGVAMEGARISSPSLQRVDDSGREWRIGFQADAQPGEAEQVILLTLGREEVRFVLVDPAPTDLRHYAFPNPSTAATTISFALTRVERVKLRIFDSAGRQIRILLDEEMPTGRHEVTWDGGDVRGVSVSSGVYFYEIEVGGRTLRSKILQLR